MCEYDDPETGIPCFQCGVRSGRDCPGRRPDEATRCKECLDKFMAEEAEAQFLHLANLIESFRKEGDAESERNLWAALDAQGYEEMPRLSALVGGHEEVQGD